MLICISANRTNSGLQAAKKNGIKNKETKTPLRCRVIAKCLRTYVRVIFAYKQAYVAAFHSDIATLF